MLLRERVAVYCENSTKHTNTLCGQNAELYCVSVLMRVEHTVTTRVIAGAHGICTGGVTLGLAHDASLFPPLCMTTRKFCHDLII
jgi:hypothetical protein